MMIETVKIKLDHPRGYVIINKSDFDPKKHELFDASPVVEKEPVKRVSKKRGE